MPSVWNFLSTFAVISSAVSAATLDCKAVPVDGKVFNLKALGGPKEVHWTRYKAPSIANTTFTIDICDRLVKRPDTPRGYDCRMGTQICGIERHYEKGKEESYIASVIPIAGEYSFTDGRHLDPYWTRLNESDSDAHAGKKGIRGKLHGGYFEEQKQMAIVDFLCAPDMEGTEGFDDKKEKRMIDADAYGSTEKSNRQDGDEVDHPKLPDLDEGKALKFSGYKIEDGIGILRLEWKTKHACEDAPEKDAASNTGGWGWFTWVLIIVFLLAATYIIFGSWLNYNRYGARGWDLVPHGDAIRDFPYVFKDWVVDVTDRFKGQGHRGGYSAV